MGIRPLVVLLIANMKWDDYLEYIKKMDLKPSITELN